MTDTPTHLNETNVYSTAERAVKRCGELETALAATKADRDLYALALLLACERLAVRERESAVVLFDEYLEKARKQ